MVHTIFYEKNGKGCTGTGSRCTHLGRQTHGCLVFKPRAALFEILSTYHHRTSVLLPHPLVKFLKASTYFGHLGSSHPLFSILRPLFDFKTCADTVNDGLRHLSFPTQVGANGIQPPASQGAFPVSIRLLHMCGQSHSLQRNSRSFIIWNCLLICSAKLAFQVLMTT